MKRILFIGAALLGLSSSWGQMTQGNVSIDPYVGVPNWANSIIWNQYTGDDPTVQNYEVVGSMLSYGGRLEYMVSDNVGVGADVNYEVSGYRYNFTDYVYDSQGGIVYDANNNALLTSYTTQYAANKLRAMFRLNYHFVQSDKVDMYSAFAGGYKKTTRAVETNPTNPYYSDGNMDGNLVPISFRIAVGAKLYFTQNIGAHVELGAFGGGLLQAGLSVKF